VLLNPQGVKIALCTHLGEMKLLGKNPDGWICND
jgi:hypothetical protein